MKLSHVLILSFFLTASLGCATNYEWCCQVPIEKTPIASIGCQTQQTQKAPSPPILNPNDENPAPQQEGRPYLKEGAIFCKQASYVHSVYTWRELDMLSYVNFVYEYKVCKETTAKIPVDVFEYKGPIKSSNEQFNLVGIRFAGEDKDYYTINGYIDIQ